MNTMVLPNYLLSEEINQKESILHKSRENWITALFISSTLGVLMGLFGLVINGLSSFGFLANDQRIGQLGIWLIVVTFPLAAFTAHCLDKIDEANKTIRIEYCRKHGMNDKKCS